MKPHHPARAACTFLLALAAFEAQAQDATRIVAATVYPDSARVERELKVPGGTRHVVIACLPAAVDVSTLQVDGNAALRIGEIRHMPLPSSRADECAPSTLEARQRAQELQRATLEAQRDSNELALSYLKAWGAAPRPDAPAPVDGAAKAGARPPLAHPGAAATDLRKAALALLLDQARVKRELAALAREADRAADDAPVARGKAGWRTVRFDVWTPAPASLRVRYNVSGTWWRPTYRATMDTAHATLRIDRQADIVQASGEDWSEVRVKLSTGRVNRTSQAPTPQPWTLDLVAPVQQGFADAASAPAFAPAPVPLQLQRVELTGSSLERIDDTPPPWGVEVVRGDYATEFDVAQAVTLASDGETHTLQLATQTLPATLKRRKTPRIDRAVYLLAEAARPADVWPAGPLQAWLDGALVSRGGWQPARGDRLEVALGQDDQMHVDIESPGAFTQARGVFGGSTERTSTAVYAVVNQHPDAVTVEVLDASPVSRNEAIRVTHAFVPLPTATDWNKVPGIDEWTLAIPAQETRRVSIAHTVTAAKDAVVANLP